jgi:hypothetical protein
MFPFPHDQTLNDHPPVGPTEAWSTTSGILDSAITNRINVLAKRLHVESGVGIVCISGEL